MELLQELSLTLENILLADGTTIIGGQGTRCFSANPPAIGSAMVVPWGQTTYPNIILKSITTTPYFVDGIWKPKYVCNYETNPALLINRGDSWRMSTQLSTLEQRSFTAGVQAVTLDAAGGQWRLTNSANIPAGDVGGYTRYNGKAVALASTGTFTIPKIIQGSSPDSFIASLIPKLSKLNSDTFNGFPRGGVLLESFDASNRRSESGAKQWLFTLNYHWKVINGKDVANQSITTDAWNFVYTEEGWAKPLQTITTMSGTTAVGFIYEHANISV